MTHNEYLWRAGHFRNPDPEFADCWNVTKDEALVLPVTDPRMVLATRSWQLWVEEELSEYTEVVHGRPCIPDGEAAEATFAKLSEPRCFHPDYPVDDDPELEPLYSKEEANWPDSCRLELDFGRNFDALPGLTKEQTDQIYWGIANNWTAALSDAVLTPDLIHRQQPSGIRGWHHTERMSGGTLAWNYLAVSRCDVTLRGAWNANVNWSNMARTVATGTHEAGHWLGMNHNNDRTSTLYPSINSGTISRRGYPNSTDIRTLRSLGYDPYSNWNERQPSETDLYKPRDSGPEPPPVPDLAEQVEENKRAIFQLRAENAAQQQILQYLLRR